MSRARSTQVLACLTAAWFVLVTVVGAARRDHYSHVRQYISELGEHGARDGAWVSWAGFAVIGVLALLSGLALARYLDVSRLAAIGVVLFGAGIALGYIGSAAARCDLGCPETGGSTTQDIHYLVSAIGFTMESIGIALVARGLWRQPDWRTVARVSAASSAIGFAMGLVFLASAAEDVIGLLQRLAEANFYAWLVYVAIAATTRDESPLPARP